MDKKRKKIRHLEQNAKKDDIAAIFQLYENYRVGKFVEQDMGLATQYFNHYSALLIKSRIVLNQLTFIDFRRFRHLTLALDSKITVIIGDNGAGKTSIADGIAKVLSWLVADMEKEKSNGKAVMPTDINVNADHFGEIQASIGLQTANQFKLNLTRTQQGQESKKDSYLEDIRLLGNMYRVGNAKQSMPLPLMAYYSVERSSIKLTNALSLEDIATPEKKSRFKAYKGALEGSGRFVDFIKWFIELHNLASSESSPQAQTLQTEIKLLESIGLESFEGRNALLSQLHQKQTELAALQNSSQAGHYNSRLALIKKAVTSLVPDVCDLSIDRNSGKVELKVSNFGNVVNINQLSQGQKVMVGLAADLAGRLVMLNPDEANPLDGQGIVIIDEIELHLHPRWQQSILFDLRRTFPNIQFIVTTHSPQVLSTVDVKSVRKLEIDGDNNTIISQPKFQTKGVASADIMEQLMGTNTIPAVEEALWVDQFSALLIEQDNADIQPLFDKIKAHFGTEHPVVADCENQIEMAQMKERMKARIRSRNSGATK